MPSTHTALHYHIVFSTKNRELWFTPSVRERIHAYLGGIIKNMEGIPHCVGGIGDHVHLLVSLKPTHCLSDVMRELKADSSGWIKTELDLPGFTWQEGYGAFTVGSPDLDKVRTYVQNQEEHHRNLSFQDEYKSMLERGMIKFEERYLW